MRILTQDEMENVSGGCFWFKCIWKRCNLKKVVHHVKAACRHVKATRHHLKATCDSKSPTTAEGGNGGGTNVVA